MEKYKPSWHEGTETRLEEARWPYAICVIAKQRIISQNIGIIKGMARDKAKTLRMDVPIILVLPGGTETTIIFHPDGTHALK